MKEIVCGLYGPDRNGCRSLLRPLDCNLISVFGMNIFGKVRHVGIIEKNGGSQHYTECVVDAFDQLDSRDGIHTII